MGRTFYVDSSVCGAGGSGLCPGDAAASYRELDIRPGDEVLFRRGSVFRDALIAPDGAEGAPVRFGAYGEGEKPVFLGSVDVSDPCDWVEIGGNIWKCTKPLSSEVGNLIFNGGEYCGILAWEKEDLNGQGKWHDTRIGDEVAQRERAKEYEMLLYSEGNPGEFYRSIDAAVFGERSVCRACAYVSFEDLAFRFSGVHGFATIDAHHIEMRRCEFEYIGGVVWDRGQKIRLGNAFELWDDCHDVVMEDCVCREIYDSCFTHQGPGRDCHVAYNMRVTGNRFEKYGMAAYEARDKVTAGMVFSGNQCLDAGLGFSMQDETPPRRSEIWPQPMGHHLFIWRMPEGSEGGRIEIKNNVFGAAPYGAHVYSIVSPEAEAQFEFENNAYVSGDVLMPVRWGGVDRSENILK